MNAVVSHSASWRFWYQLNGDYVSVSVNGTTQPGYQTSARLTQVQFLGEMGIL